MAKKATKKAKKAAKPRKALKRGPYRELQNSGWLPGEKSRE